MTRLRRGDGRGRAGRGRRWACVAVAVCLFAARPASGQTQAQDCAVFEAMYTQSGKALPSGWTKGSCCGVGSGSTCPFIVCAGGRIQVVALCSQGLSGAIPDLSGLAELQTLSLWGNSLTGKIPESLGGLTKLQILDLHDNQLTGPIPSLLALSNLSELYLYNNSLSGNVDGLLPSNLPYCVLASSIHTNAGLYSCGGSIPTSCEASTDSTPPIPNSSANTTACPASTTTTPASSPTTPPPPPPPPPSSSSPTSTFASLRPPSTSTTPAASTEIPGGPNAATIAGGIVGSLAAAALALAAFLLRRTRLARERASEDAGGHDGKRALVAAALASPFDRAAPPTSRSTATTAAPSADSAAKSGAALALASHGTAATAAPSPPSASTLAALPPGSPDTLSHPSVGLETGGALAQGASYVRAPESVPRSAITLAYRSLDFADLAPTAVRSMPALSAGLDTAADRAPGSEASPAYVAALTLTAISPAVQAAVDVPEEDAAASTVPHWAYAHLVGAVHAGKPSVEFGIEDSVVFGVDHDFSPSGPDEVAARSGQLFKVRAAFRDGWCWGVNVTTEATGMLPLDVLRVAPAPAPFAGPSRRLESARGSAAQVGAGSGGGVARTAGARGAKTSGMLWADVRGPRDA